jgi:diphosphomevalonate decarboxylase
MKIKCSSPINIAVIKYWGKRDEDLILPLNDSISLTINQKQISTTTIIEINDEKEDLFFLNGE